MPKHLLIIGLVWPEPQSSAAGSRMMQLIKAFQSWGYKITFASPSVKGDCAFDLDRIGVHTKSIAPNSSTFNSFIEDLQPDSVLFDRFMMEEQFGWRVSESCPNAIRILDTEDLHGLRKGRIQAFREREEFSNTYLFNTTTKRELASLYRSDLSLIISEAEMELLKHTFKIDTSLVHYVPFMLNKATLTNYEDLPSFEKRRHFVTIGNFLHEPNYNAVLYLKESIWPLIRKQLPNAELHIYGAYVSEKVKQLHQEKTGFYIKGFIDDANLMMQQAKVCLAPLRFGAGLKGKLIEAMCNGTPTVMTTIASEGLFGNLEVNGFISDTAQDFADKAVALYNDAHIWKLSQKNGFKVIDSRFLEDLHIHQLRQRIEALEANLLAHRQQNFIGQILQHHSLQSTKFMSKWIEEKNK